VIILSYLIVADIADISMVEVVEKATLTDNNDPAGLFDMERVKGIEPS
jgi:hypothetical protein